MIRDRIARRAAWLMIPAILGAASVTAPLVNAAAEPPRALFFRLAPGTPVPELTVTARHDPARGWLLEIAATHFRFAATCLPSAKPLPVGHAHVTSGDAKIGSAFAPELVLGELAPGRHAYRVELRGQDHRALLGPDGLISSDVTIVASARDRTT